MYSPPTKSNHWALKTTLLAGFLMTICGCGPNLNVARKIELAPAEIRSIVIDPISREQDVTVKVAGDNPFHVHVYLTGDEKSVDADIAKKKDPEKALGGARDIQTHSFTVTIPANKEAHVRLESAAGQPFDVQVNINN